ncbi:MAG: tRNA lysidine(34) synthetase TilS [Oscillibacter sp.]|nr:tRNA lysidine(34) synthetase TilS [Oscillibacter sp.]
MLNADAVSSWLPPPGTAAVCAASGGVDSMCLLHLLWQWCAQRDIPLTAAHFHHGLRETADRDEVFVRDWCAVRGIPFTAGHGDAGAYAVQHGLSVEEAARELRYAFLRETATRFRESLTENGKCIPGSRTAQKPETLIYTAHHAGDDAETVLLNLIRGTGLRGLAGMPRRRDGIVRPLLDVSRAELEAYAAAYGIAHVEDETNADPSAAARNRVRLDLMPLLRELNPQAEAHIRRTARQAREAEVFLEQEARRWYEAAVVREWKAENHGSRQIVLSGTTVRSAPDCLRTRLLLLALDGLGAGRKDFGAVHLDAVLNLLENPAGGVRRLDLPHGVTALWDGDGLLLERRSHPIGEAELLPGKPALWGAYRLTLLSEPPDGGAGWPDKQETGPDEQGTAGDTAAQGQSLVIRDGPEILTVSPVRAGDRLRLPGMSGSRTVKRLCLDRRISMEERDGLPAVYADGQLAAVWPLGTDAAFIPSHGGERRILVEKLSDRD